MSQLNCCPEIITTFTVGDCDANGNRPVTFSVMVNPVTSTACPKTHVQMDFGDGSPLGATHTFLSSGSFSEVHTYAPGNFTPCVKVISPQNCPPVCVSLTVPTCCCPTLTTQVTVGNCDANGKRNVCFATSVTVPTGCTVRVQWNFGDGTTGTIHSFGPGTSTFTECHNYVAGNFTPCIKVLFPTDCPSVCVSLTVPKCCCPTLTTQFTVGDCNADGTRKVCFTTNVSVPTGCDIKAQWDFGDGNTGGTHSINPGTSTFTECHDYAPGTYTATLNVLSPTGCQSSSATVNVTPCDCCPSISVKPCIEDCDKDGNRVVTFAIDVTAKPAPCSEVEVQMDFGDGSTGGVHSFPASGSGSYSETHTYTSSAPLQDHTATLNVIKPQGCPGWSKDIPKCCTAKRVTWCTYLFYSMTGSLALALALWLLKVLCAVPVLNWVLWTFLGIFVVALVIYLLMGCPKCRCGWFYLLLWRVLFGVGLLLAIFAGCTTCNSWTFWIGLGLMILGIASFLFWIKVCCVKLCTLLTELVLWIGGVLLPLVVIIENYAGNTCFFVLFSITWPIQFTLTFYKLVVFLWAIFLPYYVKKCVRLGRR